MEPMDIVGKSKEDASLPKGNYAPLWSDALATVELLATICLYLCNTVATPRYASKTIVAWNTVRFITVDGFEYVIRHLIGNLVHEGR